MGTGEKLGTTDSNLEKGIDVEIASLDILKAVYLKRHWIVLGSLYYQIGPKVCYFSENL